MKLGKGTGKRGPCSYEIGKGTGVFSDKKAHFVFYGSDYYYTMAQFFDYKCTLAFEI
jgi:hypothetical protein